MAAEGEGSSLEVVQLELMLGFVDLVASSFLSMVEHAAEALEAEVIFNDRLDDEDGLYQRVAAVAFAGGNVGLVFLHRDGLRITVEDAQTSRHPSADRATGSGS